MKSQTLSNENTPEIAELNETAKQLIMEGRLDEARSLLQSSLDIRPNAVAYRYMGVIARFEKKLPEALSWLETSLKLNAEESATLAQVAETFFEKGDLTQATAYYALAIKHEPDNRYHKQRFIGMSARVSFSAYSDSVETALVSCLQDSELTVDTLQALWYNTFLLNPAFNHLRRGIEGKLKNFLKALGGKSGSVALTAESDLSPLLHPFFLSGAERLTVYSLDFESFIGTLRRLMLESVTGGKKLRLEDDRLSLLAKALAHYCFNGEYIIETTDAEESALSTLRERLESSKTLAEEASAAAVFACYQSLHTLQNAADFEAALSGSPIASIIRLQLTDHFEQQEIRKTIQAITPIEEGVSQKVREMYEESPYPRWERIPENIPVEKPAQRLKEKGAKILVAGCGTGHEPIQYAVLFPEAEVLAVDLSLTSLSYAISKARRYNLSNITFRQADILKLGVLEEKFDCVVAGGVLHHMKETLLGWQVLTGLVKPGGIMRIGLYSKTARRHIMAGHAVIKEKGYFGADLLTMRRFRMNSDKILGKELVQHLKKSDDYYYLSMYRDMMFHVQEHDHDLDEIQGMLDKLGLHFIEFSLPRDVLARYDAAFPGNPARNSLANWKSFEALNPDTFIACYILWCGKPEE